MATHESGKGQRKRGKRECKTVLLGARVTQAELEAWEARHLKNGTHRSEVVRGMLKVGKTRKRKGVISKEAQWDYARAMLMRDSVWAIKQILKSISELRQEERLDAYANAVRVVMNELKRIEKELDALQLRGGFTSNNPALQQGADWAGYFGEV